jgi:nucleotide-binding universal stress UspA family protein
MKKGNVMAESSVAHTPPRLLLATDMSARCDRALERTLQLCQQWQAELDVLTVLEHPIAPDQLLGWMVRGEEGSDEDIVQRALEKEFADCDLQVHMHIARGQPADAIKQQAAAMDASLIVTGMARSETFGRFVLGSTVQTLTRSVPQPVLVVRNRVHGPYQRILVTTDFSRAAQQTLKTALRLFPEQELTLYFVCSLPMSNLAGQDPQQQIREIVDGEAADFLTACDLTPEQRGRIRVVVEQGSLESQLTRYVRSNDFQLAMLGSHGRDSLITALIGSVAARMLEWLPCDTLIVRQPRSKD